MKIICFIHEGVLCIINVFDFGFLVICKDTSKYGVEYVLMPSVIFTGRYLEFITPEIKTLIAAEKDILGKLQMEDGGFDITWKWYTPYPDEYEQARAWWRPRITIDKLIFNAIEIR